MSKELEALKDLLLLSKLSDGGKKGMPALKRADYNAHIIYRALERAKKEHELLGLYQERERYRATVDGFLKGWELTKQIQALEEELKEYKISDKSKEESSIEYYNLYKETKRKLKKVEEFIINCFIECDELGLEPTTLTTENGKDIVTRWRKELEEMK